ncbi:hypothetical protein [Algoriphagus winogradskyi]
MLSIVVVAGKGGKHSKVFTRHIIRTDEIKREATVRANLAQ